MKINKIISNIEKYNKFINNCNTNNDIEDIPIEYITKAKCQNDLLNNLYDEFTLKDNTNSYTFINTNDPNVKVINFNNPIMIKEASLIIDNFVFEKLNSFKVVFYTIDNTAITLNMLPFDFRGDYIEEVKFNLGQNKSLFKTVNSDQIIVFDILKSANDEVQLQKIEDIYIDKIDEEGFIVFNTDHRKDKIAIKYTPIASEFTRNINDKITSVSLKTSCSINNKITLNIK